MPVSPQDFALWSDLTGNPYPQTPAERMALAPHVYEFTRSLGRRGGPSMSPVRRAVDVVGKTALGLGAIAGAAYLGKKYLGEDGSTTPTPKTTGVELKPETIVEVPTQVTTPSPVLSSEAPVIQGETAAVPPITRKPRVTTEQIITALGKAKSSPRQQPLIAKESAEAAHEPGWLDLYTQHQWQSHRRNVSERVHEYLERMGAGLGQLELDSEPEVPVTKAIPTGGELSQVARTSGDVTPPTTAQNFNQSLVPEQTAVVQAAKGQSAVKPTTTPIESKPVTQSAVISTQQSFAPGSEIEMVAQDAAEKAAAFRKSSAYAAMQKEYPSLRNIESPTQPASVQPTVLRGVQPSVAVRSVAEREPEESPIVAMVKPAAVATAKGHFTGASPMEIRELDTVLSRSMARHTPEQRAAIRDQMLAQKYNVQSPEKEPVHEPPAPREMPAAITSGPSTESVRFAREAARGMSRIGLLARKAEMQEKIKGKATLGQEVLNMEQPESGEGLADPRLMRQMLQRPATLY